MENGQNAPFQTSLLTTLNHEIENSKFNLFVGISELLREFETHTSIKLDAMVYKPNLNPALPCVHSGNGATEALFCAFVAMATRFRKEWGKTLFQSVKTFKCALVLFHDH